MTHTPELPLEMRRNGLDPVEELGQVRDDQGVLRQMTAFGVPAYLILRHEDVREVLSDATRFSSRMRFPDDDELSEEEQAKSRAGHLIAFDPPEHTRLRRMLTPEFTVRRMRRLEPRITEIVESALDDLERSGKPSDLVAHFALPVPSMVICELLGVPYSDRGEFQHRAARQLDLSAQVEERNAARREQRAYMADLVARAQAHPGEDMLGMLVREHGDDLSADELIGIAGLLLLAGHETTSNMLALGTLALLQHPDQLAMIRDDSARAEPAVEELMRWLSIVPSLMRTTTTEVKIAGRTIPAGSIVVPSPIAANRDSALIDDPDALDITRSAASHVAFGHGVHHCLGAPLARMEMRTAFPALLRRFPSLALADPDAALDFQIFSPVYGLRSLPVTW
ncbi:cytochrome P450 [Spongiactinospora rosea]|uniref:Cytochrome P450 n=1 Tax=Spongiactinospora rosea TaxID=2248750 RepID=A0A366M302_9ACTN|nr:cytochrome P450 [Spongiactinospora rosea]RBQ20628.1 cytochrome P450 [Spongiactinospora rosea]